VKTTFVVAISVLKGAGRGLIASDTPRII